jgi:hypothetical protein
MTILQEFGTMFQKEFKTLDAIQGLFVQSDDLGYNTTECGVAVLLNCFAIVLLGPHQFCQGRGTPVRLTTPDTINLWRARLFAVMLNNAPDVLSQIKNLASSYMNTNLCMDIWQAVLTSTTRQSLEDAGISFASNHFIFSGVSRPSSQIIDGDSDGVNELSEGHNEDERAFRGDLDSGDVDYGDATKHDDGGVDDDHISTDSNTVKSKECQDHIRVLEALARHPGNHFLERTPRLSKYIQISLMDRQTSLNDLVRISSARSYLEDDFPVLNTRNQRMPRIQGVCLPEDLASELKHLEVQRAGVMIRLNQLKNILDGYYTELKQIHHDLPESAQGIVLNSMFISQ